jgi:hypothetical protein
MLKINADKTEIIVFTSQKNEKHIESISVKIGGEDIKPSKCVRNLGACSADFEVYSTRPSEHHARAHCNSPGVT